MRRAVVGLLLVVGCDGGQGAAADDAAVDAAVADARVDAAADAATAGCDRHRRPVVLAHGFLAAGDTFAPQFARFVANGYCPDFLFAFDWNSLDQRGDHVADLDAFIDRVRAATGAAQVDLVGHSAGGKLGYDYLADPARAAKVAHYVHLASFHEAGPAAVPTLNVWSDGDHAVQDAGDIDGAENVKLAGVDHYTVATSADTFSAVYTFLNGAAPATTDFPVDAAPMLAGRAVTLGENKPDDGARVQIWAVDPDTGRRLHDAPDADLTADADGRWGPFAAQSGARYEMRVQPADGTPPVHYYHEAFTRSEPLVYLRTLPGRGTLAGALLSQVPFDGDEAVLVAFTADGALLAGRDHLTVDGVELARDDTAAAADTTIATFVYDADRDHTTDATPIAALTAFPFLAGLDVALPGDPAASTTVALNGRALHVPRWPAATEGATITVFDLGVGNVPAGDP